MIQELQLKLSPYEASSIDIIKKVISKQIQIPIEDITHIQVVKKSIDARSRHPIIILKLIIYISESFSYKYENEYYYNNISKSKEIIVVGAGPAGLFAALRLIELGLKPIVLERGKDVSERKKDIALLSRNISLIIVLEKEEQVLSLMENYLQGQIKEVILSVSWKYFICMVLKMKYYLKHTLILEQMYYQQ